MPDTQGKLSQEEKEDPDGNGSVISWFDIQEEKPKILAQTDGWGPYRCAMDRAQHLASALDTLLRPDAVFEIDNPKTATIACLKHYGNGPYPVMLCLLGPSESDGCLVPVTFFQCRLRQARSRFLKWSKGVLWQREGESECP